MNTKTIHLRALEPQDLPVLEQIENDTTYWKYSNQTEPFFLTLTSTIHQSAAARYI